MKKLDVFDFDKTLFYKDSTIEFFKYCLKKHKRIAKYLPYQLFELFKYKVKIIPKKLFKQRFFIFVKSLDNIDKDVEDFWSINKSKIRKELIKNNKNQKIVISASPEFLLKDICKDIGMDKLIATHIDKKTGIITGENCHGKEKVKRLNKEIKDYKIENFYSDSLSDSPLADLSENSYLIKHNKVLDWPKE